MKKLLLPLATVLVASTAAWADLPARSFPQEGVYYQLQNASYNKIYIGYYPTSGDTEWFVNTTSHYERENDMTFKDKIDRLASCNVASAGAPLDGQLWTFIPGTGDYAGKYAMVCKAYPNGAVRKTMITNTGAVTTTGDNDSRYDYIADRTANADDVAWFAIEASGTNYKLKAVNDGSDKYLTLAGSPKNYELMRYSNNDGSFNWTPIEYKPDYQCGEAIYSMSSAQTHKLTPGKHQVIFQVGSKNVDGFMYPQVPDGATAYNQVYFGGKDTEKTTSSVFPAEYVYTINVDTDGKFTIRNYYGYYAVLTSPLNTSTYLMCTVTDEAQAEKFTLLNCITTTGYTDRYMLRSVSSPNYHVHMGDNNCFSYHSTGTTGQQDAGGFAGLSDSYSRTAGAFLMYEAEERAFSADELADMYAEGVAALKTLAEGYRALGIVSNAFPTSSFTEGCTDVNVVTAAISADNTKYQNYINAHNGKLITMQTAQRDGAYLGFYLNNGSLAINTKSEKTDEAVWYLDVQTSGSLTLRNLTSNSWYSNVTPVALENGVGFKNGSGNFFSIDAGNGNASFATQSAGSVWTVNAATYTFAAPVAGKYYRILSDRWMSGHSDPYLSVAGETRDASGPGEQVGRSNLSSYGIYWYLESGATEGTFKIKNLIDGYYLDGANGAIMTQHSAGAADYYILSTNGVQLNSEGKTFNIPNSYGIGTVATLNDGGNYNNQKFIDADASGYIKQNEWNPVRQGVGNFENNGSLWYFIAVDDEEIASASARYIAAVQGKMAGAVDDTDNLSRLCYGDAELMAEYKAYFEKPYELTTIDAVNRAKRAIYLTVDQIIARHLTDGQHIQLKATRVEENVDWGWHYLIDEEYTAGTGAAYRLGATDDSTVEKTLWTVIPGDKDGAYKFYNEVTGRTITYGNDAAQSVFPMADDEGQQFYLRYDPRFKGFAMYRPVNTPADQKCIHLDKDYNVLKWGAAGIQNSHWVIVALEDAPVDIRLNDDGNHELHFKEGTLTANAAEKNHSIRIHQLPAENGIAPQSLEFPLDISHADFDADGVYTFDGKLPAGNYSVNVPGAMVTTKDGIHTRATNTTFAIAADGTPTGIDEVTSAGDTRTDANYYDLQGRRVVNPSHGIYIHQGRKVRL